MSSIQQRFIVLMNKENSTLLDVSKSVEILNAVMKSYGLEKTDMIKIDDCIKYFESCITQGLIPNMYEQNMIDVYAVWEKKQLLPLGNLD